ncbi:hypothetical protein ACOJBZ_07100 [Enterococcus innesii]|uniref:hypothetical protein n=1 Tax=Enterococcus innesii TaxID=2839759 RepID=UPI003B5C3BD9
MEFMINGLLGSILILLIIWPAWSFFHLVKLYISILISVIQKKGWKQELPAEEKYYSIFRTPLLLYFSSPFSAVFISWIIRDNLFKHLWLSERVIFVISLVTIILFWISVYTFFSSIGKTKEIKKTIKSHKQFIKLTMFPVSMIGIIVPIISAINIIIDSEQKQSIFNDITEFILNYNNTFSLLFLYILMIEGVSLLSMGLIEHINEYESEYAFFLKSIGSWVKRFF